ncbi:MAG: DUF6873 family GME fold protein [Bacteroidota bacterium]
MYIVIDSKIPSEAKDNLSQYGQLIEFKPHSITYDAISSHPDIFLCQTPENIILAPNTPLEIIHKFQNNQLNFIFGKRAVGQQYPQTSFYNAVVTDSFLIHNTKNTDDKIIELSSGKKIISVNQGYTRCNLVSLNDSSFITSDKGIYNQLQIQENISVLYVNPEKIRLPGHKNGFFGGCCGVYGQQLFIIGNINEMEEGSSIRIFAEKVGIQIIELYDGVLYDGGSIFFIDS